jgi:hypothetical protein
LLWGAQLNVGSLQPYYPTTRKNLLGFTQEFDNAGWTKSNATVSANVAVDPQGFMTADKLVANTSNTSHYAFQSVAVVSGTTYTFSVNAKAGEYSRMSIGRGTATGGLPTSGAGWYIDLSTGAIVGTPSWTVSVQPAGSGYFRVSGTFTATATSAGDGPAIYLQDNTGASFAGDGTSGIFIWGAQLSDSASVDPYVYNPGAAPASTAYFGPRFDYNPVTLAPKGLLIEESRTNSIRNSVGVGAVAGSPGTAPTNWTVTNPTGLTVSVVGIGVDAGINYIDLTVSGTTTSAAQFFLSPESITNIVATSGQAWAAAWYIKLQSGSITSAGITQQRIDITGRDAGGTTLENTSNFFVPTGDALSSQRVFVTRTLNNASTTRVHTAFRADIADSAVVSFTLRIGLPQLEQGAFATSPILTTTAAATRAADVAVMQGANFSNWYNQTEGTVFADTQLPNLVNAASKCALDATDGSTNNRINVRSLAASSTFAQFTVRSGAATTAQFAPNIVAVLTPIKLGLAYKVNDFAGTQNGAAPTLDTSGAVPIAINQMLIGSGFGPAEFLNGHIRRVSYFPRRLSDTELIGITS